MADTEVNVDITGDASSFTSAAQEAGKSAQGMSEQLRMSAAEFNALYNAGVKIQSVAEYTKAASISVAEYKAQVTSAAQAQQQLSTSGISSVQTLINSMTGVSASTRDATQSGQLFESVLGVVGERASLVRTLMEGTANEMFGIGTAAKSAADSAEVFASALGVAQRQAAVSSGVFQILNAEEQRQSSVSAVAIEAILGIGNASKSAADSAHVFQQALGLVGSQASESASLLRSMNTEIASSAQRMQGMIAGINGIGREAKSAQASMEAFSRAGMMPDFVVGMDGAGRAVQQTSQKISQMGIPISMVAMEMKALVDEVAGGRLHNAVGTLARTFFTFSGVSIGIVATTAAVVALTAALGYTAYAAYESKTALDNAFTGAAFGSIELTRQQITKLRDDFTQYGNVTGQVAGEVVANLQTIPNVGVASVEALSKVTLAYAQVSGKNMVETSKEISRAFSDTNVYGKQFVDTLTGITAAERLRYQAALDTGSVSQQQAALLEILKPRIKAVTEEIHRQGMTFGENFRASMEMASAVNEFGDSMVRVAPTVEAFNARVASTEAVLQSGIQAMMSFGNSIRTVGNEVVDFINKFDPIPGKIVAMQGSIRELQLDLNKTTDPELFNRGTEAMKNMQVELRNLQEQAAGSTILQQTAQNLQQYAVQYKGTTSGLIEYTIAQYRDLDARVDLSNRERFQISNTLIQEEGKLKEAKYTEELGRLQDLAAKYKQGNQDRINVQKQEVELATQTWGAGNDKVLQLQRQLNAGILASTKDTNSLIKQENADLRATAEANYSADTNRIRELARLKQISYQEEYTELLAAEAKKWQAEMQYFAQHKDQLQAEERAEAVHNLRVMKIYDETLQQIAANYKTVFTTIASAVGNSLTRMITGTETWRKAVANILTSLLGSFINYVTRSIAEWAAGELAKATLHTAAETGMTGVTIAQNAARSASSATAAAVDVGVKKVDILASISASAGETFAGIFGFLSPMMGPAAAGPATAGQATVMAVGGAAAASLDVGAWDIPRDMPANIHKGEMVIPQTFASALRGALSGNGGNGGGGHQITVNYHNTGGGGVSEKEILAHSRAIAKAVSTELRKNSREIKRWG